ncbi:RNA polymerase sigma factor [Tunturiibacter gelidoferens]|nr:RNA polymerase sigma factor [Edaphobacter lichenicola]
MIRLHLQMSEIPGNWTIIEQNQLISQALERDRPRLRSFIRKHVADTGEAEDILQDVFYELLEAYRLMKPVEHVTAWLFRVARNRMIDLFRRKKPASLNSPASVEEDGDTLEDLLPSADAGPEAAYARNLLLDALEEALEELPQAQREVFIAHELQGQSFKEISAETGLSVNTLLSRKHYAVTHLRQRLQLIYEDFAKK